MVMAVGVAAVAAFFTRYQAFIERMVGSSIPMSPAEKLMFVMYAMNMGIVVTTFWWFVVRIRYDSFSWTAGHWIVWSWGAVTSVTLALAWLVLKAVDWNLIESLQKTMSLISAIFWLGGLLIAILIIRGFLLTRGYWRWPLGSLAVNSSYELVVLEANSLTLGLNVLIVVSLVVCSGIDYRKHLRHDWMHHVGVLAVGVMMLTQVFSYLYFTFFAIPPS